MAKWEEAPEVEEAPKWAAAPEVTEEPPEEKDDSLLNPVGQGVASLVTGAIAQPVAGIAGLGATLVPGANASDVVQKVQKALTYEPKSKLTQKALNLAAYPFEKLAEGTGYLGGLAGGELGAVLGRIGGEFAPTLIPGARAVGVGVKGVSPELAALRARAFAARQAGYKLPPMMAGDAGVMAQLQGVAGKIKTQQEAAIHNQGITDNLIKKDLGISPETQVTTEVLEGVRREAGTHYEAIKSLPGKFKTTDEYIDKLFAIGKDSRELAKEFPKQSVYSKEIKPLIDSLARPDMTPANAINLSKKLRFDAETNLKNRENPAKLELGVAQKRAATLIDDMIEDNLQGMGKPELLDNFRKARTTIAKSYQAQKALNPATGSFSAPKIDSKKPLTGGFKEASQFAKAFPKAAQVPEAIGGVSHYSPLDLASGLVSGGTMLLRAPVRKGILSDLYQKAPRGVPGGPLSDFDKVYPFLAPGLEERKP